MDSKLSRSFDDLKRAPNFKEDEVNLLVSLVKQHKNVLECKKTDAITWKQKETKWEEITEQFNSASGSFPRTLKNLRSKYENIKKTTKKKFAQEKIETFKTGGGLKTPVEITSTDVEVKEMLGVAVTGLHNEFDSDAIQNMDVIFNNTIDHPKGASHSTITIDTEDDKSNAKDDTETTNWVDWNPTNLKTLVSKELEMKRSTAKKRDTKGYTKKNELTADCRLKINVLAEARLELVKLQQEAVKHEMRQKQEAHEQQLLFQKEIHALKVEQLKKQIALLDKSKE